MLIYKSIPFFVMGDITTVKLRKIVKESLNRIDGKSHDAKICELLQGYQKNKAETPEVYQTLNSKIDNLTGKIDEISKLIEGVIGR